MLIFFGILILIASVLLAIFILVQNPKGGGLSGTFGGFSSQTMGVRQTTDFLEKGTWGLIIFIALLCLASSFLMSGGNSGGQQQSLMEQNVNLPVPDNSATPFPGTGTEGNAPAPQAPDQNTPTPPEGNK